MKVLMFGWEFPPHISGGLGTACFGLTKAMSKQDVKLKFVVPKTFGKEDQSFLSIVGADDSDINFSNKAYQSVIKNLEYLRAEYNIVPYMSPEEYELKSRHNSHQEWSTDTNFTQKFHLSGKYGSNLIEEVYKYAIFAASLGEKKDFDIIHAHDWLTYPCGISAKQTSGKPLIVHIHATEFDRSGENVNQAVYNIEKAGFEAADKIIAVSQLTKTTLINRYGIDESKIDVIYNGVVPVENSLNWKKNVDEKIVTFLGRITFQKGPDYFIAAAKKVLEHDKNVRFVMAGSGDMHNKMIRTVANLGISDKFHFCGFLKGAEIQKLFSMSHVFIMPSVSEPFGIVPLEAMQSNVPVIISKTSGVGEILRNAIKVDFWDIKEMANAIHNLLNYPALHKTLSRDGKKEVNNLTWDNSAVKVKEIYQSVLNTIAR